MNVKSQKGFTLMEVLIVMAVAGVLAGIALFEGQRLINKGRLNSASRELYADLRRVQKDAFTLKSTYNSAGFGLIFDASDSNKYRFFEFNDLDTDSTLDSGERIDPPRSPFSRSLSEAVTVKVGGASATSSVVLFDSRGIARTTTWGALSNRIYVLSMPRVDPDRCVEIDFVTIAEGIWDGTNCSPR